METAKNRNSAVGERRRPATVAEFLEQEQARALEGLGRSLEGLGTELSRALGRSPVVRHPMLAGATALTLGLASAPAILRGVGPTLALMGSATERVLSLASLLLGLSVRRSSARSSEDC